MNPWKQMKSAERLERIKAAWGPGMSASDIAAAIGAPSRNAVIGYYTRYAGELAAHPLQGVGGTTGHLSAEEKLRRAVERNRRYRAAKPKKRRAVAVPKNIFKPAPVRIIPVRPETAGVSLMDLGPRQCRFCINEPEQGSNGHLFCGETTEAGIWCAFHEQIVWGRGTAAEAMRRAA